MIPSRALLFILQLLLLASCMAAPGHAGEGQRVILVLDASGSMWGQIDGRTKMDIAKEVVGKVVAGWKPEDTLGLVAYGHRRKGACDDIEVLTEPGKLNSSAYMSKVMGLTPKGKTPMTQAVRQAAEALKFSEQPATVILVSDGIETCDPDPCAVAGELERLGVALTVHTVGFGLDDKGAVAQLECLAENTGGLSFLADNAGELQDALTRTVTAKPEPVPQPEPVAMPDFNLTGTAIMAAGAATLPKDFDSPAWEVFALADGQAGEHVKTGYGSPLKLNIEQPGDYLLRVSLDQARFEAPVRIEPGKIADQLVNFNAGVINLSAKLAADKPLTDPGASWELLDQSGQWVATKYGAKASYFAGAGTYKIRLKLGDAVAEQLLTFTAGKIEDVSLTIGAGSIEVSSVFVPGGPEVLSSAAVELRKGQASLNGEHEWIATNYGSNVRFDVQAGKYRIVSVQDFASGAADVDVRPGQVARVEVSVNAGFLAVKAAAGGVIEVYSSETDSAGNRKYIATGYNGEIDKAFNAGVLHVVSRGADGNVAGEKDFEVKAGQRTEGTIP